MALEKTRITELQIWFYFRKVFAALKVEINFKIKKFLSMKDGSAIGMSGNQAKDLAKR